MKTIPQLYSNYSKNGLSLWERQLSTDLQVESLKKLNPILKPISSATDSVIGFVRQLNRSETLTMAWSLSATLQIVYSYSW